MPRNSAGVYNLPAAYNPVVTDEFITSLWANTTLDDLAQAISNSLDRYGSGGMLAPFKNFDGTLAAPGVAFTNEGNTGLARLAAGELSVIVLGAAIVKFLSDRVEFQKPPQSILDPVLGVDLVRLSYLQDSYAPTANPVFTGTPKSNAAPVVGDDLTNKTYVDNLAFSTALPDYATQPTGNQIVITAPGVVAWSPDPSRAQALAILNFIGY
jgi:hypothetical protein